MTKLIPLTKGQFAIVDDTDFDRLSQFKWCALELTHTFYAMRNERQKETGNPHRIYMHRLIMNTPSGFDTDHHDHDGLNNTRANLRICTRVQNTRNARPRGGRSEYKGVSWHNQRNKWITRIRFDGTQKHVGIYTSESEAARAYDAAALLHFGEFARLNFPQEYSL
jgi:hypothetical protein